MKRFAAFFVFLSTVLALVVGPGVATASAEVCPKAGVGGNKWVQVCIAGDPTVVPSVRQCGSDCIAIDLTGGPWNVSVTRCFQLKAEIPCSPETVILDGGGGTDICVASVAVSQADESCAIFVEGG